MSAIPPAPLPDAKASVGGYYSVLRFYVEDMF